MRHCPIALAVLALTIVSVPAQADSTVNLGTVSQFTGPGDLNLDPANVVYAVNFSNNDGPRTVGGVTFDPDTAAPAGFSSVGPNEVTPWQNKPEYGPTTDDNELEEIMADIRWANAGPGQTLQADMDVNVGTDYRLQLLISGNHQETRQWDIQVEGMDAVDELSSLGIVSGGVVPTYDPGSSVLYEYEFTAGDDQLNVVMGNLFGDNAGGDRNPIWQGVILSEIPAQQIIPEPNTLALVAGVLGIAGFSRPRSRRK